MLLLLLGREMHPKLEKVGEFVVCGRHERLILEMVLPRRQRRFRIHFQGYIKAIARLVETTSEDDMNGDIEYHEKRGRKCVWRKRGNTPE